MNAEELTGQEHGWHNVKPVTEREKLESLQFEYRLLAAKVLLFYLQEKGWKKNKLDKVRAENDGTSRAKIRETWAKNEYNNILGFERSKWCKFYVAVAGISLKDLEEWVNGGNFTRQKKRKVARMSRTEINN